jgi:hypothetical protein
LLALAVLLNTPSANPNSHSDEFKGATAIGVRFYVYSSSFKCVPKVRKNTSELLLNWSRL